MKNPKKQQSKNNGKTGVLRASNTVDVGKYQKHKESPSEVLKMSDTGRGLSPTIYNRLSDFSLLFLGVYSRFCDVVRRPGCGDLFALFVVWLFILSCGYGGVTINGLIRILGLANNGYSVRTLKYRVKVLKDCNAITMRYGGRYTYYVASRYAEKNILNFEIAKKDIVSFVASFRRVMKEQSRPGGKV